MNKTWLTIAVIVVILVIVATLLQIQQNKEIAQASANKGILGALVGS